MGGVVLLLGLSGLCLGGDTRLTTPDGRTRAYIDERGRIYAGPWGMSSRTAASPARMAPPRATWRMAARGSRGWGWTHDTQVTLAAPSAGSARR